MEHAACEKTTHARALSTYLSYRARGGSVSFPHDREYCLYSDSGSNLSCSNYIDYYSSYTLRETGLKGVKNGMMIESGKVIV